MIASWASAASVCCGNRKDGEHFITKDGSPHVVPIGFRREGDDILFGSDRENRKVHNLLANPQGAVTIGGELPEDDEGYLIQGDLSIEEDSQHASMWKMLGRHETEKMPRVWPKSGRIMIGL